MSTEHPVERWFTGLEGLEVLASECQLRVVESDFGSTEYPPGTTLRLSVEEVARIGLRLIMPSDLEAIAVAVEQTHLPPDSVKVVVIAEDRFLKERVIVHGPVSASELQGEVVLTKVDDE